MTGSEICRPRLDRSEYADLYGPTKGDQVRLADTVLWIEITDDWVGGPGHSGDEEVFGGGKMVRESMGQSTLSRAEGAPDTVITGAVIVDHWGVVKADVALLDGHIVAMGKAYNPDIMEARHGKTPEEAARAWREDPGRAGGRHVAPVPADIEIGPETEVISGNGKILTAGGVDTHVHFVSPDEIDEALASGVTTLIGGGVGPAQGSRATTVTPGAWHIATMFEALDGFAVNIGLLGQGATMSEQSMKDQLNAGVMGFKVHEDWGATPAVIKACLKVCRESGVQLAIHTDTLNEAGDVESTLLAFGEECIHAFHVEGAGGGHAPDLIEMVSNPKVLPASTNPTRPLTVNTVTEHLDMLMVAHHLSPKIKEDLAFADSRIRPSTMAAEDVLHDLGAISIMSSDAQAMGRIGEMIMRTWQTAHVMRQERGRLVRDPDDLTKDPADNMRVRRYVAKYTINPAIAHGIDETVGSVEPGKLADLALWEPAFFGVKPDMVIKGGQIAYAQTGDANGSIPTPQPVLPRRVFGAVGDAPRWNSVNFVSEWFDNADDTWKDKPPKKFGTEWLTEGLDSEQQKTFGPKGPQEAFDWRGLRKQFRTIKKTRDLTKASMRENNATPEVKVDPKTFVIEIIAGSGGETEQDDSTGDAKAKVTDDTKASPEEQDTKPRYRKELPMAQLYHLF